MQGAKARTKLSGSVRETSPRTGRALLGSHWTRAASAVVLLARCATIPGNDKDTGDDEKGMTGRPDALAAAEAVAAARSRLAFARQQGAGCKIVIAFSRSRGNTKIEIVTPPSGRAPVWNRELAVF